MRNSERWADAFGVIGVAFAIAFALRGCSSIMIEQEKTEQIKAKYEYEKGTVDTSK
jgi:uncharacterized protein YceK